MIRPLGIALSFALGLLVTLSWSERSPANTLVQKKGKGKAKGQFDVTPEPGGRPKFKSGSATNYWIWHDDNGWHLRTTTPSGKQKHRFHGSIRLDNGMITRAQIPKDEILSSASDRLFINKQQNAIVFDFVTVGGMDGISFKVNRPAQQLLFDLRIDGQALPQRIVIGRGHDRPVAAQFALPAHPRKKK